MIDNPPLKEEESFEDLIKINDKFLAEAEPGIFNPDPDKKEYFTPFTIDIFGSENLNNINNYLNKFRFISPSFNKLLRDFSTAEFIQEKIAVGYGLTNKQSAEITRIIRDTLLGGIFLGDLVQAIQSKLSISEDTSKKIASLIISDLFAPIIEDLKRDQKMKFADRIKMISEQKKEAPKSEPVPAFEKQSQAEIKPLVQEPKVSVAPSPVQPIPKPEVPIPNNNPSPDPKPPATTTPRTFSNPAAIINSNREYMTKLSEQQQAGTNPQPQDEKSTITGVR
jgi:hypothetical protein